MKSLLTSAAFFVFSAMTPAAMAAPAIVVEQPIFNFGTISEGTKIDHIFTIKNGGDSPLTILHIRPSCGCTAANASSPVVQPGKTSEIKASFNSANFPGNIAKTIAVETNDPKTPTLTLTMKGKVSSDVQVSPKQLNLGQIKAGTTTTQMLVVTNNGHKPLKLSAKTPMPQVALRMEKQLLKKGESTRIHVSVKPRAEDRILSGYLTINTDNPAKPELTVPVYGSLTK